MKKNPVRPMASDQELIARATRAYFVGTRSRAAEGDYPSNASAVEEHEGKFYVVLRNAKGVVSVYRVRNDGMLKNLKRWPRTLES
jgi:hypothetical protein